MAKRKRIKKAGQTQRNIHKLATTLTVVPLVAMSTFLFSDSYALANGGAAPIVSGIKKSMNLSETSSLSFSLADLFPSYSGYSFTGVVSVKDSFTNFPIEVDNMSSGVFRNSNTFIMFNCGDIELYGIEPGSYTITVTPVSFSSDPVSFTLGIIEPAFIKEALDLNNDGLDVKDIMLAINNHATIVDTNGDGAVNSSDYSVLLGMISSKINHNPSISGTSLADQFFTASITDFEQPLSTLFTDSDGDSLTYRVFADVDSVNPSTPAIGHNIYSNTLNTYPLHIGSTTFTIVADDNKGGYATRHFTASKANIAPVVSGLHDLVMNHGATFNKSLSSIFTDPDVPQYDQLSYNMQVTGNNGIATFVINGGNIMNVEAIAANENNIPVTITATDSAGAAVSDTFDTEIFDHVYYADDDYDHYLLLSEYFNPLFTAFTVFEEGEFSSCVSLIDGHISIAGHAAETITFTIDATDGEVHEYKTFVIKVVAGIQQV